MPSDVLIHQYQAATPSVIVLGVPTFGMVSIHWHAAMLALQQPMNRAVRHSYVMGREVGDARNEIVQYALGLRGPMGERASHVFFIDDDTLPPPGALVSLLAHRLPIVAGLYYAKTQAPQPLVLGDAYAGTLPFTPGDLVPCGGHGMGCTLIDVAVFRALWEQGLVTPAEKTDLERCRVCGGTGRRDDEDCGGCFGTGAIVRWYATVREYQTTLGDVPILHYQTEDMHFLERAKKAGHQPTVDTSIFCWHWHAQEQRAYPVRQWEQYRTTGTWGWT